VVLRPIGRVESALVRKSDAPKQGHEGGQEAWLAFDAAYGEGLRDLEVGEEILLLTWLDRADREVLSVHPRDDARSPLRGVFSTRSADRPNPIGLHRVTVRAIEGTRVKVSDLEALDGTPILDVKPVLDRVQER
jgi:tRNA-Thr(GGU) m(6)t(6)A37 methyltransferase TsaA